MMDSADLRDLHQALGVSQANMANAMGMPFNSYQKIEMGPNPVRPVHAKAATLAALELAMAYDKWVALPFEMRDTLHRLADSLTRSEQKVPLR